MVKTCAAEARLTKRIKRNDNGERVTLIPQFWLKKMDCGDWPLGGGAHTDLVWTADFHAMRISNGIRSGNGLIRHCFCFRCGILHAYQCVLWRYTKQEKVDMTLDFAPAMRWAAQQFTTIGQRNGVYAEAME